MSQSDDLGLGNRPPKKEASSTALDASKRFLLLILIAYLMAITPLTWLQRSLIYQGRHCPPLDAKDSGLPQFTFNVEVTTFDDLTLHGWLAAAGTSSLSDSVDPKQALAGDRPVVMYFPGNAGNRSMRVDQMAVLGSMKCHVLLVDYRGYADNLGKPTEENFSRDARSAWNYLTQDLGVSPHRIVIYGESLGGGTAVRLASNLCQQGISPGGLIIQSTFSSLVATAQYHFPFVPVSLLLVDRFASDRRITHVTCPILQIHGQQDSIVPFWIGQKLFDAAPAKSASGIAKQQVVMPHTDHNDVYSGGPDYEPMKLELNKFLDAVAAAPAPEKSDAGNSDKPIQQPQASLLDRIDGTVVVSFALILFGLLACWLLGKPRRK